MSFFYTESFGVALRNDQLLLSKLLRIEPLVWFC
jgi:hypothetical protein